MKTQSTWLVTALLLSFTMLGSSGAMAKAVQIPPVSSDGLEYRCGHEGGSFEKHADGSYLCRFRDGTTISCTPDQCITYLKPGTVIRQPVGGQGTVLSPR